MNRCLTICLIPLLWCQLKKTSVVLIYQSSGVEKMLQALSSRSFGIISLQLTALCHRSLCMNLDHGARRCPLHELLQKQKEHVKIGCKFYVNYTELISQCSVFSVQCQRLRKTETTDLNRSIQNISECTWFQAFTIVQTVKDSLAI